MRDEEKSLPERPQRQYLEVPLPLEAGKLERLWRKVVGLALFPVHLAVARLLGGPGVGTHLEIARLAVRLLLARKIPITAAYTMMCCPLDSTRYFEFQEVLADLRDAPLHHYLDISSPRLIPLMLLKARPSARGHLLNPDSRDLEQTARLAEAMEVTHQATFVGRTLQEAGFEPASFDLITCISVLEHIPEDRDAVSTMWSLLRPGGRLVLTVPCMARPLEQYTSNNEYGVLSEDADGYTFWQRFYDSSRLQHSILDVTGPPEVLKVFGERAYGLFYRNATLKRVLGALYPFWQESTMVARDYRIFHSIEELPGEGVVLLSFRKQAY